MCVCLNVCVCVQYYMYIFGNVVVMSLTVSGISLEVSLLILFNDVRTNRHVNLHGVHENINSWERRTSSSRWSMA